MLGKNLALGSSTWPMKSTVAPARPRTRMAEQRRMLAPTGGVLPQMGNHTWMRVRRRPLCVSGGGYFVVTHVFSSMGGAVLTSKPC